GALPSGKILFEGQDLATITQRISRQHSEFGQRVDHDSARVALLHLIEHGLGGVGKLYLGRMEDGVLTVRAETALFGQQFKNIYAVESPSMRLGDGMQFRLGLGQCDVQRRLTKI